MEGWNAVFEAMVALVAVGVAVAMVLGWGGMHVHCGLVGYDSLLDWEHDLLERDVPMDAFRHPPLVGDNAPQTLRDLMGQMAVMNDMVYYDAFRPFALLPCGKWIPHGVPDANLDGVANTGLPASPQQSIYVTELLLNRAIDAIRAGDWHAATCHAGALAHYVQEPYTPGHAMPNDLFYELFPDPDPGRHLRMHMYFDSAEGELAPVRPALLGRTVPEAAIRIQTQLDRAVQRAKACAARLVATVHEGRHATDGNAILLELAQGAVALTASAWHTLLSIGTERFDPDDGDPLECMGLNDMVPMACHPGIGYAHVVPNHTVHDCRRCELVFLEPGDDGTVCEHEVEHGLGMTAYMSGKYYVNGDVFPRFRCRVGLSSRYRRDQQADTQVEFAVEGDPGENRVYSPDIDYGPGARRLATCVLRPDQPAQTVDVSIAGVRTLIVKAISPLIEDPVTRTRSARYPHVVVADPVVAKT